MTTAEAKNLLLIHSFAHSNIEHPKMRSGFLGSLRPCLGKLDERNYLDIMAALRVLAPIFRQSTVDREIISSLWSICCCARAWGVHPNGMLQRNGLIKPEDVKLLEDWTDQISWTTMLLLQGGTVEDAFPRSDDSIKA